MDAIRILALSTELESGLGVAAAVESGWMCYLGVGEQVDRQPKTIIEESAHV